MGEEFFEVDRDLNDLYTSELLRAIPDNLNLHYEGSHHGGGKPPKLSGHRSGTEQNEPPRGGVTIPVNIEVEREEGREERANSDQGSNEMSPSHRVSVVMQSMQRLKEDCEKLEKDLRRTRRAEGGEELQK